MNFCVVQCSFHAVECILAYRAANGSSLLMYALHAIERFLPPSSFLLPPHYCRLGAGSIPFRAIVNKKQCETRGLFMSLVSGHPLLNRRCTRLP